MKSLINRFAKFDYRTGKGTKKKPDYFYGFNHDIWQAFALGIAFFDKHLEDFDKTT